MATLAEDKQLAMQQQPDSHASYLKGNDRHQDVELGSTPVDIERIEKVYK